MMIFLRLRKTNIGLALRRIKYETDEAANKNKSQTWAYLYVDKDRVHPFQAQKVNLESFFNVRLFLN